MSDIERRALIKGAGLSVLAFSVGGAEVLLSPRAAHAQNIPFRTLTPEQSALGRWRDFGSWRQAGRISISLISSCRPHGEALLERAFSTCGRLMQFLSRGARRVDKTSQAKNGDKNSQLTPTERHDFVDLMRQNKIEGWQGPAGPFVYLIMRSDAVDVVYGTMEGYAALGIPYMPHIAPEKRW